MSRYWTIPILSSILILGSLGFSQDVFAPANQTPEQISGAQPQWDAPSQAIPEWVKTQFAWYVNGEIDEKTLLTSMNWMFDNNLMHLSEEAADEVNQLREVNKRLHYGISSYIEQGDIDEDEFELLTGVDVEPSAAIAIPNLLEARKSGNESTEAGYTGGITVATGDVTGDGTSDALNHLRKAYDLNPNHLTFIFQYDEENDELISVEGFEWHTTNTPEGEILSPTAIQRKTLTIPHVFDTSGGVSGASEPALDILINIGYVDFASSTVNDVMIKGGTTSEWEEGITAFSSQGMSESVAEDLQRIVVLCNTEIDKKTQQIDSELDLIEQWLKIIEENQETSSYDAAGRLTSNTDTLPYNQSELDFIGNKLSSIDQQIKALSNGVAVLDRKVQSMDESNSTTQTSADMIIKGKKILQNLLEEQQKKLDGLSEKSQRDHDGYAAVIQI